MLNKMASAEPYTSYSLLVNLGPKVNKMDNNMTGLVTVPNFIKFEKLFFLA